MKTKNLPDPTADEMRGFLTEKYAKLIDLEESSGDIEAAIYWFAYEWHGGQFTNLYSALSTSPYSPGPCTTRERETDMVRDMVCDLEEKYAGVDYSNQNPCELDLSKPCFMLWHGGSSYAVADQFNREHIEEFASVSDALAEFDSRPDDSYFPCVSRNTQDNDGPSAWICFADPYQVGDLYPDAVISFNVRGVAVITTG
jgi:hypothetical protein